jgi:hypothetical protein
MMGLQVTLGDAAEMMKSETTNISVASACELFARFVTRTSLDTPDFGEVRDLFDIFIDTSSIALLVVCQEID